MQPHTEKWRARESAPSKKIDNTMDSISISQNKPLMNMTLCRDKCSTDCKTYLTPVSECFNSAEIFPNDASWSGKDVLDAIICQTLRRRIFPSSGGSCSSSNSSDIDKFLIPLFECVGPFGQPRPWGTFSLLRADGLDDPIETLC